MNKIDWIYIIDDTGATIFSYQSVVKGSLKNNNTIISHFLHALQSVSKNLDHNEIKSMDLGNNKFFLSREKLTNYLFIIKSDQDAELDFITLLFNQVKHKFVEKFSGHFKLVVDDKIELLNSFKEDVREILMHNFNLGEVPTSLQEA